MSVFTQVILIFLLNRKAHQEKIDFIQAFFSSIAKLIKKN